MSLCPRMKSFKQEIKANKSENCRENIVKNVSELKKKAGTHAEFFLQLLRKKIFIKKENDEKLCKKNEK